jgi:hypothetical protein
MKFTICMITVAALNLGNCALSSWANILDPNDGSGEGPGFVQITFDPNDGGSGEGPGAFDPNDGGSGEGPGIA